MVDVASEGEALDAHGSLYDDVSGIHPALGLFVSMAVALAACATILVGYVMVKRRRHQKKDTSQPPENTGTCM